MKTGLLVKVFLLVWEILLLTGYQIVGPISNGSSSFSSLLSGVRKEVRVKEPAHSVLSASAYAETPPYGMLQLEAPPIPRNILIRVNWLEVKESVGDIAGEGELRFSILAIRQDGDSAQLVYPGTSAQPIVAGQRIKPDRFSLAINDVKDSESIYVIFIAHDEDKQSQINSSVATIGLAEGAELAVKGGLTLRGITLLSPVNWLLTTAIDFLAGTVVDYWEQADILGEYAVELNPYNSWFIGNDSFATAERDNLLVNYSVLSVRNVEESEETNSLQEGNEECLCTLPEAPLTSTPLPTTPSHDSTLLPLATPSPTVAVSTPLPTVTSVAGSPVSATVLFSTPAPTLAPTPIPVCDTLVHIELVDVWLRGGGYQTGCPTLPATFTDGAYQLFQNGLMLYVASLNGEPATLYVLYNHGGWHSYPDTWDGTDNSDYDPPESLYEPNARLGDLWHRLGGPDSKLGWALHSDVVEVMMLAQPFSERGVITAFSGAAYLLADSWRWVKAGNPLSCNG